MITRRALSVHSSSSPQGPKIEPGIFTKQNIATPARINKIALNALMKSVANMKKQGYTVPEKLKMLNYI